VFVVDQNNDRVEVFNGSGIFQRSFPIGGSSGGAGFGSSRSGRSQGITSDASGRIYVADTFQGFVRVFDTRSNLLSIIGSIGEGPGQFRTPVGLATDGFGRLLVASVNNSRVEVIGLDGYLQLTANPPKQLLPTGAPASFSVSISGAGPFTYQWRKGVNNLVDGPNVSGATGPTLALAAVSPNDSGLYSVLVTGPSGVFSSPNAALTVLTPPSIVSQATNQTVWVGQTAFFRVGVSGDSLYGQWQFNGIDLTGATNTLLGIPNAQTADAGSYTFTVSNLVGSASSAPASLTVLVPPGQPQIDSTTFQPDNTVLLIFHCDPGFNYAIDASDDLLNWVTLSTRYCDTGSVEFNDTDAFNHPHRFYRLRWAQ
jgi:hypothetical protein